MRSSKGPLWNQHVGIKRSSRLRTVDSMTMGSRDDGAQQLVRVDRCLVADLPYMPRARRQARRARVRTALARDSSSR